MNPGEPKTKLKPRYFQLRYHRLQVFRKASWFTVTLEHTNRRNAFPVSHFSSIYPETLVHWKRGSRHWRERISGHPHHENLSEHGCSVRGVIRSQEKKGTSSQLTLRCALWPVVRSLDLWYRFYMQLFYTCLLTFGSRASDGQAKPPPSPQADR